MKADSKRILTALLDGLDPATDEPLDAAVAAFLRREDVSTAISDVVRGTKKSASRVWPPPFAVPDGHALRTQTYYGNSPREISTNLKALYPKHLVFVQSGYFLEVFDEDAERCSTLFGWQLSSHGATSTGVPVNAFRFKDRLKNEQLPYIIVIQRDYPSTEGPVIRAVNELFEPEAT